jgi:mono/diheme cytochrome c family protein
VVAHSSPIDTLISLTQEIGQPHSMDRYKRTLNSLLRRTKIFAGITTTSCFVALAVTLTRGLAQVPVSAVHAYTNEDKTSGPTLFHEKGCEHCHGVDGRGGELGPDLSTVGKRLNKQKLELQIRNGGFAMPAFGDVLQPDEIKALVDFLHTKRKAPKQAAPPKVAPSPATKE